MASSERANEPDSPALPLESSTPVTNTGLFSGKVAIVDIVCGADHAHNDGADRRDGSGAFVNFRNAHAVVIILRHIANLLLRGFAMFTASAESFTR